MLPFIARNLRQGGEREAGSMSACGYLGTRVLTGEARPPPSAGAFRPWVALVPYHGGSGNGASGLGIFIAGFEPDRAQLT